MSALRAGTDRWFFFYCYGVHRDLHSFPTRRSSDLPPADSSMAASRVNRWELCRPSRLLSSTPRRTSRLIAVRAAPLLIPNSPSRVVMAAEGSQARVEIGRAHV